MESERSTDCAHQWYAYWFIARGRAGEVLEEERRARESDPLSLIILTDSCELLIYAGQYDQAAQQAQKALELDSNFALAHAFLGEVYERKQMYREAIAENQEAFTLSKGDTWSRVELARIYPLVGQRAKAEAFLHEMLKDAGRRSDMQIHIASIYAALGDKDRAFAWLEKAYQNRDGGLILLKVAPIYDPLRLDPRFADLERRVGLPQ